MRARRLGYQRNKAGLYVPEERAFWSGQLPNIGGGGGGGGGYPSGLKGLWHMDEVGGNRADSVNSTTLTDNASVGSATGILSNAASFGAGNSTQFLSAASNANITAGGDFTAGGWFNLSDTAANHGLVSKGAQDAYEEYSILYNAGGDQCRAFMRDLGTQVASSLTFTATGVWHFAAIIYDSTAATFKIRVDTTVDTTSSVPGVNTTTTGTLKFGRTNGATWMEGLLDNWFFYQRALSSGELDTIYNSGSGLAGP
jgi:hypothetical protein